MFVNLCHTGYKFRGLVVPVSMKDVAQHDCGENITLLETTGLSPYRLSHRIRTKGIGCTMPYDTTLILLTITSQ